MPVELTPNSREVLERRYLLRDAGGALAETPEELFRRVARTAAAPDALHGGDPALAEEAFFRRMAALEFLPNSPALRNAGRGAGQLAACFVLPVEDSIEGIFDAVKWAARIQVSGGGTGFDFSRLRPAGDPTGTGEGVASGPLAFMDVFDAATDALRPESLRRGANMGILRVDHPDVEAFVRAKLDPARLTNFNVSVAITDAFMEALAAGAAYGLVNPRTGAPAGRLPAARVFSAIAECAWTSGEPGVIFVDRVERDNPTPALGRLAATNPCSEQPLLPFEACVLGSIDVSRFAAPGGGLDRERLAGAVHDGVHFLDNLVDATRPPLPQIAEITRANRKIGLGVMGFADLLVRLGIPYDDERAVALGGELMALVEREALAASARLARERGPFPAFPGSRWDRPGEPPLRNATLTTVAPTGTLSILAGCSSGIEPIFALSFVRRVLDGARLVESHRLFREALEGRGLADPGLLARVAQAGRARGVAGVPADLGRLFPVAHDVAPEWHLRVQAAFQRHVHSAVSKTINFPATASADDVARALRLAWDLGCKGVTVYRDGSRAGQVLAAGAGAGGPACSPEGCG